MANFTKYAQLASKLVKSRDTNNIRHLAAAAAQVNKPKIEFTKVNNFIKINL